MNDELTKILKHLRLGGLLAHWDDYLKVAADQHFSHHRLLTHVLEQEYRIKQENAHRLRLKQASIPELLVMETFPFDRQPKLNKAKILALYDSMSFIKDHQNILWLGVTGCGKTGLATSFLIRAIDLRYSARFVPFAQLIDDINRSIADHSEEKTLKKYLACDILLIDEIGYIEVEPAQVGLFFTLMQRRHKKMSTLITSNLGFGEWKSLLKNDHLTAALIDRLTENSHVFNMKGCKTLRSKLDPEPCPDP